MIQQSTIRSRPKVDPTILRCMSTWFRRHGNAILSEETEYLTHKRDLFAIVAKDKSPLRRLIERTPAFLLHRLAGKQPKEGDIIHYLAERRTEYLVSAVLTLLGLAMLITPLWILSFVEDQVKRLSVITCFVVAFLPIVTFTSSARPFELLAATAG